MGLALTPKRVEAFLVSTLVSVALGLTLLGSAALAHERKGSERIVAVPAGKVIEGDFLAYGDVVEISGIVNGDVYAAARRVSVDGTVNGDLLAAAGSVAVSGKVAHDARIAGGKVTVSGGIGRNLSVGSGDFELTGPVAGSLAAAAGKIMVSGPVGRGMKLAGGDVFISGRVSGDIEAAAGQLRLSSSAAVTGDITYWSRGTASIDRDARVMGSVRHRLPLQDTEYSAGSVLGFLAAISIFFKTISVISTLVLGLLLVRVFPAYSRRAVATLRARPFSSLGVGFALFVLVPVASFILLLTVVGIGLSFLLSAMFLISLYLTRVFVIYWAGAAMFRRFSGERWGGWPFAAGLLVYTILIFIPLAGFLVGLFTALFGLGAAALTKLEFYREAKEKGLPL